ncbi:ankyrin repeat family A protein 2-like [Actinia tenebrosa]|uniref:Ankyrin repeat family A protein 2-like n=1 Tax=Actinia tenebrosa TaxID=6105 RepID=A0A6P8INH2_ACTTE|nr:ankyrin repeat family A protein 2-like [Actinia tenebrosa]
MSTIELEWTSFIQQDNFPKNDGQSVSKASKILPKSIKMKNKKRIFSPVKTCPHKGETDGAQVYPQLTERCWTQADNMVEQIAATDGENQLSLAESSKPSLNTIRCGDDNLNLKVLKTTKAEEKNKDDQKWTSDVIFEAEQIVMKSEIDNIQVNKPLLKKKEETDEGILREPLGEGMKAEIPSLVNLETFSASPTHSKSCNSSVERRGMYFRSEEDVNSKTSSIVNVARKISRSTSRSLKSLNSLRRFVKISDKNVPMSVKQQQSEEGAYALLRAAKNDSVFQIQTLVTHGISTEIIDQRGWTPLTIALENENMKCAEVLVEMNANANFVHANGMTILHHITSTGTYKGVKFLLRHGANVNAENSEGWPPVHYAIKQQHLKCAALLLAAGCDSQTYTHKRLKEYEEVVRLATIGKWKYHWQQKLDIDMSNEIRL